MSLSQLLRLCIALPVILAAMSASGVSGAAATEKKTVLCEDEPNFGTGDCEGGIFSGEFEAISENASLSVTLMGMPVAVTCESEVEGEVAAEKGQPQLPLDITNFSLTSCTDSLGRVCTVTVVQLPYEALLSQDQESPGVGTLAIYGESGQPGAHVICQDTNIFKPDINCTYKTAEVNEQLSGLEVANLEVLGGTESEVIADQVQLKESSGTKCTGSDPIWDAVYKLEPEALWVAHVEQ